MAILVTLCCVLSIVITGSWAAFCTIDDTPAVQMCQSGTVSGNTVHIDTRGVPDTMAVGEECTCEVDLGGGTVDYVDYSGPDGGSSCGYLFNYATSRAGCSSFSDFAIEVFTSVTCEILLLDADPFACFSLHMDGIANATITCHEYSKTTTSTTASTTETTSTTPTRTTPTTWTSTTKTTSTITTTTTSTSTTTTTSTNTTPTTSTSTTPTTSTSTTPTTSTSTTPKTTSTSTSTAAIQGSSGPSTGSSPATEEHITTDTPDKKGLDQTTVIGIAAGCGGAVLIIIVVTVICCCRYRKGSKKSPPHYENAEADTYMTENALYGRNTQAAPIVAINDVTAPQEIDHYTMVDIDNPGSKDKNRASQMATQTAVYDHDMASDDAGLSVRSSNEAMTGNTGHMTVGEGGALYAVVSKRQPADTAKGDNSAHGEPNNTEATYAVVSKKKKTAPSEGDVEASPEALPSPSAAEAEQPIFTRIVGAGDYAIVE